LNTFLTKESNRNNFIVVALAIIVLMELSKVQDLAFYGLNLSETQVFGLLYPELQRVMFIIPFGIIILCLAYGRNLFSRILEHPLLVLLGEASYSLYLIHWITMSMFGFAVNNILKMQYNSWLTFACTVIVIIGTIILSVLCYKFVETPARRKLRSRTILFKNEMPYLYVQEKA
jgi:peptidoglycan/LPS O-acetylase OafA/YrhL